MNIILLVFSFSKNMILKKNFIAIICNDFKMYDVSININRSTIKRLHIIFLNE